MQSFQMPTLSLQELNLNFSEDEDDKEDVEDDKKMMRLLLKLKTAKESLDDTKRKKRLKQATGECIEQFLSESRDLCTKHNKKWAAKASQLAGKFKKIKNEVDDLAIEAADMSATGEDANKKLEAATGGLLKQLVAMQNEYSHLQADVKRNNVAEMEQIKSQISQYLLQVQSALAKTQSEAKKEDKMANMFKSALLKL